MKSKNIDQTVLTEIESHIYSEIPKERDYKKVNKFFGWKPKTTFIEGLNKTIKWYTDYLLNENSI